MKKRLFILLTLAACRSNPANIQITVDHNSQAIKLTGLIAITLQGIKRDSITLKAWQSLFPVCVMPADTELRNYQPPLPGKYLITDSTIMFTPDTAFKAGQTYFARYYSYDKPISTMDLVLHRRVLGEGTYTELIFKY